ncbi:MAG: YqzL family protein [Ruminococcaceae bacterium]|nr:YqzL family protein [Oscillospiraceae bacterium]
MHFLAFFSWYIPPVPSQNSSRITCAEAGKVLENLGWEHFCKTGDIEGYLLYKEIMNFKENCGGYGANQNDGRGHQTDSSEGQ